MATPQLDILADEILADLAVDPPYGVAWWAPYPGTSRRILISDQLYSCVTSVPANLTEAALHRLEFLEAADRESDHLANVVTIDERGEPRVKCVGAVMRRTMRSREWPISTWSASRGRCPPRWIVLAAL